MSIPSLAKLTNDANSQPDPSLYEIIVPLIDDFLTVASYFESNTPRMEFMTAVRQSVVDILLDPNEAYKHHTFDGIFTNVVKALRANVGAPKNDTFGGMFTPTVEKERHVLGTDGGLSMPAIALFTNALENGDLNQMCNLIAASFVSVMICVSRDNTQYGPAVYVTASMIVFIIRWYLQQRATTDTVKAKLGAVIAFVMDVMAYAYIGIAFMGYQEVNAFFQWVVKDGNNKIQHVVGYQNKSVTKVVVAETLRWSLRFLHIDAEKFKVDTNTLSVTPRDSNYQESSKMQAIEALINKFFDSRGTSSEFSFKVILQALAVFATRRYEDIQLEELNITYSTMNQIEREHFMVCMSFIILRVMVFGFLQDWSHHATDIQTADMKMLSDNPEWKPRTAIKLYNEAKTKHKKEYTKWAKQRFDEKSMTTLLTKYGHIFDDHHGRYRVLFVLWTKPVYSKQDAKEFHLDINSYTEGGRTSTFADDPYTSSYYPKWIELYSWICALTADVQSNTSTYPSPLPRVSRRQTSPVRERPTP
jgi:hypothetical protein